jgi:hypothetical protein
MSMSDRYGISRVCGGRYPLTAEGLIPSHAHETHASGRSTEDCPGGGRPPYRLVTSLGRPLVPFGAIIPAAWAGLLRLYHASGPLVSTDVRALFHLPATHRAAWVEMSAADQRDRWLRLNARGRAWVEANAGAYRAHYPEYDIDPDNMINALLEGYREGGILVEQAWSALGRVLGDREVTGHLLAWAAREGDLASTRDAEALLAWRRDSFVTNSA